MSDNAQMDLFEPEHVSLVRYAKHLEDQAAPMIKMAKELRARAKKMCPHTDLIVSTETFEDKYGRMVPHWTEVWVTCDFCKRAESIGKDEYDEKRMTPRQVFERKDK